MNLATYVLATYTAILNLATSSCFETQALKVQIIIDRILCKKKEVLCSWRRKTQLKATKKCCDR